MHVHTFVKIYLKDVVNVHMFILKISGFDNFMLDGCRSVNDVRKILTT